MSSFSLSLSPLSLSLSFSLSLSPLSNSNLLQFQEDDPVSGAETAFPDHSQSPARDSPRKEGDDRLSARFHRDFVHGEPSDEAVGKSLSLSVSLCLSVSLSLSLSLSLKCLCCRTWSPSVVPSGWPSMSATCRARRDWSDWARIRYRLIFIDLLIID